MNIFRNYIPNIKVKLKYGGAPWIYKHIKSGISKRSVLNKKCYVNDQVQRYYHPLKTYSKKCTEIILSAKNDYMLTMRKKLNNPLTAPNLIGLFSTIKRYLAFL